jgi:hypothetical protein
VDQGAVDAGGVHGRDRLLGPVALLAMTGTEGVPFFQKSIWPSIMFIGASCFGLVSACCTPCAGRLTARNT